jgi:FkbM family methyltransferase
MVEVRSRCTTNSVPTRWSLSAASGALWPASWSIVRTGALGADAVSPGGAQSGLRYDFARDVEGLDAAVRDHLDGGFVFANIGASDGVTADPLFPLIERHGGRGIAAEPVPHIFDRLVANTAHLPEVVCEQVAVSSAPGQTTMWYIDPDHEGLDYILQSIGSLDRDHLLETLARLHQVQANIRPDAPHHPDHGPAAGGAVRAGADVGSWEHPERWVRSVTVEAVTFDQLLARNRIDAVDVINIDVEGHDYDLFRSIDWARWRPAVVIIETAEMTEAQKRAVAAGLEEIDCYPIRTFGLFSQVFARPDSPPS